MEDIIRNNYAVPSWDYLSHYPFGRPFDRFFGWEYTMALLYLAANLFGSFTTIEIANIAPVFMIALSCIVAYFLGKMLNSCYSGLTLAFLISTSPVVLGLTMAGMCDSDAAVIFMSLLSAYSLVYAYRKPSIKSVAFAVAANSLFMVFWVSGFYVLYIFAACVLASIVKNVYEKNAERAKKLTILLASIFVPTAVVTEIMGVGVVHWTLERIVWSREMIVNISVAELMPINHNIFKVLADRVGDIQFLMSLPALFLFIYRFIKNKADFNLLFIVAWYLFAFLMVTKGVRFALLFAIPCYLSASYAVGEAVRYSERLQEQRRYFVSSALLTLMFVILLKSLAYTNAPATSANWLDAMHWLKENAKEGSLVFTYWDPGHFISYFGFKNTGDGAHCSSYDCVVYDFNERIQDEARVLVTSNETEALEIVKKYARPPPGSCEMTREMFVQFGRCEYPEEVYFIASQDLIYKYQWLSYFAGYRDNRYRFYPSSANNLFSNPGFCEIRGKNLLVYCPWVMNRIGKNKWGFDYAEFRMEKARDGNLYPFYVYKVRVGVAGKYLVNYLWVNGKMYNLTGVNVTDEVGFVYDENMRLNGVLMVFGKYAIYLPPEIKDSILVRTLFENGRGLGCFEPVYQNEEVKIYKIKSECLEIARG